MNKIILMGRLVVDPEVIYGGANNTAIANFRIAVRRRFKREGESDTDFFRITALGKQGEFVEKYLRKGTKILLEGEIRNNNYTNRDGEMVFQNQIIAQIIEFAESKKSQVATAPAPASDMGDGFMNIPEGIEDELPFN